MDSLCAAPPSRIVARAPVRGTAAARSSPSKTRSSAVERAASPAKARRIIRSEAESSGSLARATSSGGTTASTSRAARSAIARRSLEAGDGLLLDAAAARTAADPRKEALRNSVVLHEQQGPLAAELDVGAGSRARRVAQERGPERETEHRVARRDSPPRATSPLRDSVAAQARCDTSPFKVAMSSRRTDNSSSSSSRTRVEATRTTTPATRVATQPTPLRSLAATRPAAVPAERVSRPAPLETAAVRREREAALASAAPSSTRAAAPREHFSSPMRPRSGAAVAGRQRETSEAGVATRPSARRVLVLPSSSSAAPSSAPAGTPPRAALPRPAHATAWRASPGRAQRGIFVHEAESESAASASASASASAASASESDDELADCSPCKAVPPVATRGVPARPRVQRSPASYPARSSASSSSSTSPTSSPSHPTAAVAAPTLSPETSSALASLEASLARLALPKHARRRTIGSSAALLQPYASDADAAASSLKAPHVASSQHLSSPARRTLDSPTRRTLESPTRSEHLAVGSGAGASSALAVGRVRHGGSLFALAKPELPTPSDAAAAAAETLEAQREARRAARKLAQREMQREADEAAQAAVARARAAEAQEAKRRAEEEEKEQQEQRALRRQERAQQAQAQTQAMRVVEAQKERRRVAREEAAARLAQEALEQAAAEQEAAAHAEAAAQAQAEAQRQADDDERAAAAAAERAQAKASRLAARLAALRLERPAGGDEGSGGSTSERRHARRQSLQLVQTGAAPPVLRSTEADDDSKVPHKAAITEEARAASPTVAPAAASRVQRRRSMYTYVPTQRVPAADGVGDASTRSVATAPVSERFLRGVVVLVDVRDQDGSEASARWIEQLRGAGARVSSRAPAAGSDAAARLTHIVFKSGRPATLHAFRALPADARPALVGVNWIRQCLEERRRVDEAPFLVELGKQAVFQKRRTSMAPRLAPGLDCASPFRGAIAKEVEAARKRELVHRPAVPSPLAGSVWRPDISTDGSEL